jgi:hypothetical protein
MIWHENVALSAASEPNYNSTLTAGFSNVTINSNWASFACQDIDSDGDLDLFIAAEDGSTYLYRNDAGAGNEPVYGTVLTNPFGITNVGPYPSLGLVDIDGDSDLDLFIGNSAGNTIFFRNTAALPVAPVASITANGSYGIGAVITLSVRFSEAVLVNTSAGTPRLQLETGAIDRYAIYSGGSGTNTLSFSYTVQAGDSSADLDQLSANALELNGGTIKDAAGNSAFLTLAAPGATGSLGANANLVINTSAPAAPGLSLTSDTGSSPTDRLTNNASITVTGLVANATWQYSTNGGNTWSTAQSASTTSFSLPADSYTTGQVQVRQTDAVGNTSTANTTFQAFTVDTTAPTAPSLALAIDSGVSPTDGITNNGIVNVAGLEAGASWQYSTDSGANWSASLSATTNSFSVAAGSYSTGQVQVRQSDAAGNSSPVNNTFQAFTVDTTAPTAPTLALASDTGSSNSDGITNNGTVNVLGLEAGASWQYSTNGGTSWSTAQSASSTSFSVAAGSYTTGQVQVRQSDAAGNSSPLGQLGAITVDTTAPTAPTLALTSDTGSSSIDRLTNNPGIIVAGLEAGASWQYSTNGGSSWSAALSATTTSFSVAAGSYTTGQVQVRQTDAAGNSSPATTTFQAFTVDTTAPTTTAAITAVADNVGLLQGSLAAGAFTDDATPSFTGTISAALASGESLRIFNGTTLLGSASVNNTAKTWSFTPTALAGGAGTGYAISARVADAAGNLGTVSAIRSFTLDTSAPSTTAAITAVNDNVGLIQGNLSYGASTDDTTPTFSGTISAALASGETLRISNGAAFLGLATVDNATLTWAFTPTTALPNTTGTWYDISALVADAAGNLGTVSARRWINLDSTAPSTTAAITAVNDNVGLIQGNLVDGASTDDTTPSFSGTISAALVSGETLRIFNGTTLLGTASVNNATLTWAFTPTTALPNASGTNYNISARVADAVGNLGIVSATRSFTLDTSAPSTTAAITAVNDNVGLIQGNLNYGAITDDATPTFSGTISAALASGETLRISNGATFLGLATVDNATLTWAFTPTTALPNTSGTSYSISARVADAAGNLGIVSATRYFSLDTTASSTTTAAITAVNDNVGLIQGNLAASGFTDDTTPTFTGTISAALASGETLRLFNGTTLLGSASVNNTAQTWSFTPTALAATAGTAYSITARVADAAGNLGAPSASYSLFLDTTAPTKTAAITAVADDVGLIMGPLAAGAFTDDTTPSFSGTISAALASGETLRIFNGTTMLGSANVTGTTWSFTPAALPNGFYAVTARVADAAGNLGAVSAARRFSLDATANQMIGDANANSLNATSAKDLLTGLAGADTFSFATLTASTLATFDRITDFAIGTDRLDGPTAVTAANINKLGAVSALDATSIGTVLTSTSFLANGATTFTYADPSGISRSFIALNDGIAGYSSSNDAIVEITGYTGLLANLAVI